ncbi:MAG: PEP-CTERM-box response regulator transcription factor [Nitrospirae bacterium RBG_16_64_22]|nr:MAG: PEP-CTERM-box response regulator transcription factor [Nitrospirae bacterium RBG_16_64_22]
MSPRKGPANGAKPKLLVVDDNPEIRTQLKWGLNKTYEILEAEDRAEAVRVFRTEHPAVVTLDLGMPPDPDGVSEGMGALDEILSVNAAAKVILVTGNGERTHARSAIERGAWDYYTKPVDLDEVRVILARAFRIAKLESENRRLAQAATGEWEILGASPEVQRVLATIRKVGPSDATVLVTGESGTGKELVARQIHALSPRRGEVFAPINCGAIPETLLEAELFGHEKGAFTGAHVQRRGKVEYASGGTLFLDEITEMSPALQVKLLRFLQEGAIDRIGGRETIPVDVRVIAATNRDIGEAISAGLFREDLYYRLAVVEIPVPPLRSRGDDVLLLARVFFDRARQASRRRIRGFAPEAEAAMRAHSWPGNVRELENRVRRAVIMADDRFVTPGNLDLLPAEGSQFVLPGGRSLREARESVDREMVKAALMRNGGNILRAAEDLQVSRPTLHDLINKLEIIVER